MNKKIVIVQTTTPQYRTPFFQLLRSELAARQIELKLLYGEKNESKKNDFVQIPWATFKKNRSIGIGKQNMVWQPILSELSDADMVILPQHNRLLLNYILLFGRFFTNKRKIAFWGHGRNMQIKKSSLANSFKRLYSNNCDWWFAYTNGVKKTLVENGYPEGKITVVQNSIDTRRDVELFESISQTDVKELKESLRIAPNDVVGIYCGGMYKEKRIQFLLSAADKIYANCPNFKLIFLGDGPDSHLVAESTKTRPWLIWVGSKFGREKCMYFKASDFFLMPGLIGLAILDSFIFQTPIITTDYEFHSPEFEYLENDVNGIVTKNNLADYVQRINELIKDRSKLVELKKNCATAASKYSIETMVSNFVNGIVKTLNGA